MARQFAKITVDIAEDEELENLSTDAQWLYFRVLLPDPGISLAGVLDWHPGRVTVKSSDMTRERVDAASRELDRGRYAHFDEETNECLVRSKLRRDGSLKSYKCGVSVVRSYRKLASKRLRRALVTELRRIHEENPTFSSWSHPDVSGDLAGIMQRPGWGEEGVSEGVSDANWIRSVDLKINRSIDQEISRSSTSTASGRPAPRKRSAEADQPYSDEFESWWKIYPRRAGGKRKAFIAYTKARTKVDDRCLMDAAMVYSDSRVGEDPRFTAHPTTWLNQERWNDEIVKKKSAPDITDILSTKLKERIEREEQRQLGQ